MRILRSMVSTILIQSVLATHTPAAAARSTDASDIAKPPVCNMTDNDTATRCTADIPAWTWCNG